MLADLESIERACGPTLYLDKEEFCREMMSPANKTDATTESIKEKEESRGSTTHKSTRLARSRETRAMAALSQRRAI